MKKFYRDKNDIIIGGVISGLAKSYNINIDVTILRIIAYVMLIFSGVNSTVLFAYMLAWSLTSEKDFNE